MQSTTDFSTPESRAEAETMNRFIEHAPQDPGPLAPTMRGWWLPAGNYLCARCAGRIIARGCAFPRNAEPVWSDGRPEPFGVCCCCEGGRHV
jgi:hypothetical protein